MRWADYSRFMLEPVELYAEPEAQFDQLSSGDKTILAEHMYRVFRDALEERYEPASEPGPRTLRVKLVLTGAKPSTRFLSTAMKLDGLGTVYNTVQAAWGRPGAFSGWAAYSVEIYDAESNELLAAYLETQYPNAMNIKASGRRLSAIMVGLDKGARALINDIR